jgi:hypothetical protein
MARFRRYAALLIATATGVVACIFGLALWLDPLRGQELGDLTRIGWYSNNWWGFRKPMIVFSQPLYRVVEQYEEYSDVYILGDSFSFRPAHSWPNYLGAAGISSQVVIVGGDTERRVNELVASPLYQERPPKVVVYASVERASKWRLERVHPTCPESSSPHPSVLIEPGPRQELTGRDFLQPRGGDLSEDQITYARDFIKKNIKRRLVASSWPVHDLPLKVPRFSSVNASRTLFISDEPQKRDWTDADFVHMRCALRSFQDKVQANGRTLFVHMLIPDKLSVYHADLVDPSGQPVSVIPRLEDPAIVSTRLDRVLRAAVEHGEIDVYLPNDTHWGASGHRLAAQALLDLLRAQGVVPAGEGPELGGAVAR